MAKKFVNRFIQQVDQTLGRAEKSEVLTKNMDEMSHTLQMMEEVCQTMSKRLREVIPDSKRKKTPEDQLAQTMRECGKGMGNDGSNIGILLNKTAEIEECLSQQQIQFDIRENEQVLAPMITLDDEYKRVLKMRKHLAKLTLDMDAAKKKYNSAARQSSVPASDSSSAKLSVLKDEMDELTKQVDHDRDALQTDMLLMTSREADLSDLLLKHIQLKAEYHQQSLKVFESLIPEIKSVAEKCTRPVFGTSLREHLYRSGRKVAFVLEYCAEILAARGLYEEGVFRLAGSTSKVKMLKAAFDAQTETTLNLIISDADHHSIAATLKCYLRELPEPLTTTALYDDWMDVGRMEEGEERCKGLVRIIDRMPESNRDNLSYLIKFLSLVASASDKNKMTPGNLAIVVAPNLFWNGVQDRSQFDMSANSVFHSLVEFMIKNQREIFPGDWESGWCDSNGTGSRNSSSFLDLPSNDHSNTSPRSTTPPEFPQSTSPRLTSKNNHQSNNNAQKKKPAPSIPPVPPKRTELLHPSAAVPNSHPKPPSAPPETPCTPPVLYPDITSMKGESGAPPIVSFEPTIVPVAFNVTSQPLPALPVAADGSPNPQPRRRIPATSSYKDGVSVSQQSHSRSGSDAGGGSLVGNGDGEVEKPVIPAKPVIPPRQISENNTYL